MKVLQVIPALADRYGGPSEAVLAIARELRRRGDECLIVGTDADGPGRLPVICHRLEHWRGAKVLFFPRQGGEAYKYSRSLARWLAANAGDFDVAHVHGVFSHASLAAARACHAHGTPYLLRPLGSLDPSTMRRKWLRKRIFWALHGRRMALRAAAVHYATERERRAVEASLGLEGGIVIPTGIELAVPGEGPVGAASACADSDTEATDSYVLAMARLDPIKRIDLLIDAFLEASAIPALAHWRLRIAGDGEHGVKRRLQAQIHAGHAADRVELVGWVSGQRKEDLLRDAALFAHTSRHENFGRAVAEALGHGVPALVTRQVYLSDAIEAHDAGWVVNDSRGDVVRALREAMSNGTVRRAKGARAAHLAHQALDVRAAAERLQTAYRQAVRRAPRARSAPAAALETDLEVVGAASELEPPS